MFFQLFQGIIFPDWPENRPERKLSGFMDTLAPSARVSAIVFKPARCDFVSAALAGTDKKEYNNSRKAKMNLSARNRGDAPGTLVYSEQIVMIANESWQKNH